MSELIERLRAIARRDPYILDGGEDAEVKAIEDLTKLVLGQEIAIHDHEIKIDRLERRLRALVDREARR